MLPAVSYSEVHNITSADIAQLTDTDSKAFVNELTEKASKASYVRWFGVLPLVLFLLIMVITTFSSRRVILQPATDSIFAKVNFYPGVNIRKEANAKSLVLKTAVTNERFQLLDSTQSKWLKVGFNDSIGYVARRFAAIEHIHHEQVESEEPYLSNAYAPYEFAGGTLLFIVLIRKLKKVDKRRFEMALHYEMDEQFRQVYRQFNAHFTDFAGSARIWQYVNARQTNDYKRTGGAGKLINRVALRGISANQAPLSYFSTNITIPCIKLSNLEFYFLPERLLVKRGKTFAAIFYKNLRIDGFTTRFIEDESVPRDAKIIDQTWRYVNKHGGPDRRFNNNRQIPVCAYSEYTLTSDSGIYEVITTSKQGAMDAFAGFLGQIGKLQTRMAIS
ncbi:SH3 domain-containing protein [Mucilaginibacter sabulilitoris]|uniref:SH3 domain-containing protein n=1 Tax=Mucilaginibacter sabulilitoris TaxID=1173583 RepID=A0ABZ0TET3_9SPHI|nr:SH3 domain-containing protein [Mucilaginibacter sabulilitoris]WPU91697.1 SH3 domain-containing protein [Mucilaginibacter sabulilitoris]